MGTLERAIYMKQYYLKNKERLAIQNKAWRKANPGKDAIYNRKYRLTHQEKDKTRKKNWWKENPGYNAARIRAWRKENPDESNTRNTVWRKSNPEKAKAQRLAKKAVKAGKIVRKPICDWCGLPKKTEFHHPDYSQPLDVMHVCKPCHYILNRMHHD